MSVWSARHFGVLTFVAAGLAGPLDVGAQAAAAPTGALTGTVVDERTFEPIEGALVAIVGPDRRVYTDAFGQFLLEGVELGPASVRFASEGYVAVIESIEIAETDFVQVWLRPVTVALDELMVVSERRASGEVAIRRDVTARTALDVLADDVPGVMVRRGGGSLGSGAAIAIRGVGTFRDSSPDIVLDGVRINDPGEAASALHVLDLIPAETVSRIRVFKGASAAVSFSYGANGVIVIETIRGTRGG